MSLFYPRFVVNEFNPVFRLLEDLQAPSRPNRCGGRFAYKQRSFQPRFDVTENKDHYELKGELPGIDQKNIEIAFTDEHTLTVKGHTGAHRGGCSRRTAQPESQAEQEKETEAQTEQVAAPESETSSYHKASVEEEFVEVSESDATMSGGNPEAEAPKEVTSEEPQKEEAAAPAKCERSKTWLSERSAGRFYRSFQFAARVDQENVTASLKDGILSVVIPKAALPENKRIEIQ